MCPVPCATCKCSSAQVPSVPVSPAVMNAQPQLPPSPALVQQSRAPALLALPGALTTQQQQQQQQKLRLQRIQMERERIRMRQEELLRQVTPRILLLSSRVSSSMHLNF